MDATLDYAESHFSQILDQVMGGEEVVLRRGAVAVAKIVPLDGGSAPAKAGKASEWLKTARGSVKALEGESVDDLRSAYYAEKYGLKE